MAQAQEEDDGSYKRLENKWWKHEDWIAILDDPDIEPSAYQVIYNFMMNKVVANVKCVEVSGQMVPRVITVEVKHPDRPDPEFSRIMLSPTDVAEGVPIAEPDLLIKIEYYDFIRILNGQLDLMRPLFLGRGTLIGNMTAAIDLRDIIDAANNKPTIDRPNCWPRGHP